MEVKISRDREKGKISRISKNISLRQAAMHTMLN